LPMSVLDIVHYHRSAIGVSSAPTLSSEPVRYGRRRSDKIPWAGVLVLLAATLFVFFGKSAVPALFGTAAIPFELQATDVGGQMRIRWNGQADDVAHAESATLEIADGKQQYLYPVSRDVLASGALDYTRRTDDVVASLVLHRNGRESERRIVRSISAPSAR
jgi:hypothetical protein